MATTTTYPELAAPALGMAGWGVEHNGFWLSDGYDSAEDATTAAQAAWHYHASKGMGLEEATVAAAAMMAEHLGEWSDMGKDMWGSRPRSEAGLRSVRAAYWHDVYTGNGEPPMY